MHSFKNLKKLVIAPHIDDEVLGLGGLLDEKTHILHLGCAAEQNHGNSVVSRHQRLLEWNAVVNLTKCTHTLLDNPVNNYATCDLISPIEQSINSFEPDICFIPNTSYNQDHKAAYEASIIALRPHDLNHSVSTVFIYYQPQDLWCPQRPVNPDTFFSISIDDHINLYLLLRSQVRHYRSPELIKSQLAVYGGTVGFDYALAFKTLRNVYHQ
jgi:LmbE family N-acetylglucosaminyl deacetylase